MSDDRFPVPAEFARRAWVDEAAYRREYARSIADPGVVHCVIGERQHFVQETP